MKAYHLTLFCLFLLFLCIDIAFCQLEIIQVSSAQSCFNVDPSAASSINGVGRFLNCSNIGPNGPPPVTVIDLRVIPGIVSQSEFIVNLTIVKAANSIDQQSTSTSRCLLDNPQEELCTVTTPSAIRIKSSKGVLAYDLRLREGFDIPYGYVSMTAFDNSKASIDKPEQFNPKCKEVTPCNANILFSCSNDPSVKNSQYCKILRDSVLYGHSSDLFKTGEEREYDIRMSIWDRVNTLNNNTIMNRVPVLNGPDHVFRYNQIANSEANDVPANCVVETDIADFSYVFENLNTTFRGNKMYRMFPVNSILDPRGAFNRFDILYGYCNARSGLLSARRKNIDDQDRDDSRAITGDKTSVDIRTTSYRAIPSIGGLMPKNIYQVNDLETLVELDGTINQALPGSKSNLDFGICGEKEFANYDYRQQTFSVDTSMDLELARQNDYNVLIECASPRCGANVDNRLKSSDLNKRTGPLYATTHHSIASTGPYCKAYEIDSRPSILIELQIEIDIYDDNGNVTRTETVTIDNINEPQTSASSKNFEVYGRVVNSNTNNFALGPNFEGFIVVCGRNVNPPNPIDNDFIDMRYLRPALQGRRKIIDNPWDYIISQRKSKKVINTARNKCKCPDIQEGESSNCYPDWENFYPHPADYAPRGFGTKDSDSLGLPQDKGHSFWYFVSAEDANREFGTTCNKVGMKGSSFFSQQSAQNVCSLPTHECVPGVGKNYDGGLKVTVPANVASTFLFASGAVRRGVDAPKIDDDQEVIYEVDENPYHYLGKSYDQYVREAQRFMPNDPFYGKTQYNPKKGNMWLVAGEDGRQLIYDPSPDSTTANDPTATITPSVLIESEVTISLLGSFVGYKEPIAAASIVARNNSLECIDVGDRTGTLSLQVLNLSQKPFGVNSSYVLSVGCNPKVQYDVITPATGYYIVDNLAPGQLSATFNFTVEAQSGATHRIPLTEQFCTANLTNFFAGVSTVGPDGVPSGLLDSVKIICGNTPPFQNPLANFTIPPIAESSAGGEEDCNGCFDYNCFVKRGELHKTCQFWITILVVVAIAILFIISTSLCFSNIAKQKTLFAKSKRELENQQRMATQIAEEEERRAQIQREKATTT